MFNIKTMVSVEKFGSETILVLSILETPILKAFKHLYHKRSLFRDGNSRSLGFLL